MRLIVGLIILAFLVLAVTVSLLAKPLEARTIVCNPVVPVDVNKQRFKGVQKV